MLAIAIVLLAWVTTDLNRNGTVPANIVPIAGGFTVARARRAPRAALEGGLRRPGAAADHHRAQRARPRHDPPDRPRPRQARHRRRDAYASSSGRPSPWRLAVAVLVVLRDHRLLRRYTYSRMAVGFVPARCSRSLPGLGRSINGSQIWISIGPLNFQPGEFAKIALAIFFAGYLVQTRDALSLAGKQGPRPHLARAAATSARSSSPGLLAPARARLREATSAPRCCSSASSSRCSTSPPSACRGSPSACCSSAAPYASPARPSRTSRRACDLWLDPFSPQSLERSNQLANGPVGHGLRRAHRHRARRAAAPTSRPSPRATSSSRASARSSASSASSRILVLYLIFCRARHPHRPRRA